MRKGSLGLGGSDDGAGDGAEEFRLETALVAVTVGTTIGGGFRISPGARLDDGLFDVVWTDDLGLADVLRLVPALLKGTHLSHPKVHSARAAQVEVTLSEPVPAHVDGELLEPDTSFQARVLPGALRVLSPR
jgi:diacylglycerol kinase (ATP)